MSSATASATGLLTSTSPARRNHPAGRFWERVADPLYAAFVVILLGTAVIAIIYPLYFVVIASISDPNQIYEGNVWLWPKGITFEGYARMFSTSTVIRGFANSLLYTVVGATILVCSILGAGYALSRRTLPFRRTIMAAFIVTMFFDGGMIARYLVVRELGMLNTMWAVVLPGAIGVTNLVIARTFFSTTPKSSTRRLSSMVPANCATSSRSSCRCPRHSSCFWLLLTRWRTGTSFLTR